MAAQQSYASHRRYKPWHHFVVVPILLINLIVEIVRAARTPTSYNLWLVVFAFALVIFSFTSRGMSLRAQDRVIRLEERLRLGRILSAADQSSIDQLNHRQLIALRFAPDDEVPDLVRRCVNGELQSGDDIKRSIKNWRPDYLRV